MSTENYIIILNQEVKRYDKIKNMLIWTKEMYKIENIKFSIASLCQCDIHKLDTHKKLLRKNKSVNGRAGWQCQYQENMGGFRQAVFNNG